MKISQFISSHAVTIQDTFEHCLPNIMHTNCTANLSRQWSSCQYPRFSVLRWLVRILPHPVVFLTHQSATVFYRLLKTRRRQKYPLSSKDWIPVNITAHAWSQLARFLTWDLGNWCRCYIDDESFRLGGLILSHCWTVRTCKISHWRWNNLHRASGIVVIDFKARSLAYFRMKWSGPVATRALSRVS